MTAPRVLQLINSCSECPKNRRASGGGRECEMVAQYIHDQHTVASFCPLPIYPSGTIAGLERTVRHIQSQSMTHLGELVLKHLLNRLKLTVHPKALAVDIPVRDTVAGKQYVTLHLDSIKNIDVRNELITFVDGGSEFALNLYPPDYYLKESVISNGEKVWRRVDLLVP